MKVINFIIILFFFSKTFGKGGGSRGSRGGSRGGRGATKYLRGIRFSASRIYGRSRLWFPYHYVNIHYIGHYNYYNEEEYNEGNYDFNEIYLIYAINGTFLWNHLKNSKYKITGHYITFTEYEVLPYFIENLTEFKSIFGNETRIILSSYYSNNNNSINNTIIDYIDEDTYQKIMIDVITDVHYVPFYKLFPNFFVDEFLLFLTILFIILLFCCISFFYSKFRFLWIKDSNFPFIYELTLLLMICFIIVISINFNIRDNYILFLTNHIIDDAYFVAWQILQLYFIVYLLSFIIDIKEFRNLTIGLFIILMILEYVFESNVGFMLKFIVCLKVLYLLYSLCLIVNDNQQLEQPKEMYNINVITIILIIFSELIVLIHNGLIFYSNLFNFYLILIAMFFSNYKRNCCFVENDKISFLNKNYNNI